MILRQLRVLHDNNEENFEIKKERVVIGRGKKCDIVLDSNEISRRHLAIVSKHDQSYVENLSSSGEILLTGELVEYSEIKENDELVVGPYTLFLSQGNAASTGASAMDNSDEAGESFEKIEDNSPAEEGFVPVDSNADDQLASPDLNLLAGGENISADNDINFPATADSRAEDPGRGDLIHEDPEEDIDDGTMLSDGATVVHDQGQSYGILKITKGPKQGEEIKLQHGSEWVIGRDTSCHICIEEKKISLDAKS